MDERVVETHHAASEARPIEEAGLPGTGLRRRPGELVDGATATASSAGPRAPSYAPISDPREVARRRRSVDLPVLGVFGPYEILGRLAMGGMAEILLARRPGSEPLVIKKILAQYARDEDFVEMFLDEARIGSALDHPNIGRFLDFGEIDRQLFIAMEWVHGVTLGRLIRRARDRGGVPFPIACELVARVADALHYAHTARDAAGEVMGLVHRDVSPHNVMIDFDGTVKLLDFGIAKAETQSHHTQAGVVKGKFAYMAPEQCRGNPLDFRIDIFALGVVLFESLTSRSLYRRENEAATMQAIVSEPVPSLMEKLPEAPRELEAILQTALQKDPGARFPTAAAMRDVLRQYVKRSAEDVGQERISALVQHLFRDELEAPLVDSTPFGASYEIGSGRAVALDAPDGRATLAPPGTGSRSAKIQSQIDRAKAATAAVAPTRSPSLPPPAAPVEPRLSMELLFGDAEPVVEPAVEPVVEPIVEPAVEPVVEPPAKPPAKPPVSSTPNPSAAAPAPHAQGPALGDPVDPLGLFADLPVPEVEVDVEVHEATDSRTGLERPAKSRAALPPEPTRAPRSRAGRKAARTAPPQTPPAATTGETRTPGLSSSTPSTTGLTRPNDAVGSALGDAGASPKAAAKTSPERAWKLLVALLAVVLVALAGYAMVSPAPPSTTTLEVVTVPPGAPVSVNGSAPRRAPATFSDLPPGTQSVRIEGSSSARWEGVVDLTEGTARTLRIVLE